MKIPVTVYETVTGYSGLNIFDTLYENSPVVSVGGQLYLVSVI